MIWSLLILMQFKHFIADYPLQTPYMLGKFKDKDWIKPLAAHCAVHYVFTFFIAFLALYGSYNNLLGHLVVFSGLLATFDFTIHFIMDRLKASPRLLGKFQAMTKRDFENHYSIVNDESINKSHPTQVAELKSLWPAKLKSNQYFWYSLGLDQMVHHLTDIAVVYFIIKLIGGVCIF